MRKAPSNWGLETSCWCFFRTDGENEVFIGAEDLDFEAESRIRFLREYLKFAFENKECLEAFNRMQTELN
jgi:hypothetical protein